MATASAKGPSKTAFVRNFIKTNPTANRKAVEEAWRAAGHEGPISSSLVSNLRTELGLTGKKPDASQPRSGADAVGSVKVTSSKPKKRRRRAQSKASGVNGTPATQRKPRTGNREQVFTEIEGDIDRLIFKLMVAGGMEKVEDALREVRRLLYRTHKA
jgi:hypothetical protein